MRASWPSRAWHAGIAAAALAGLAINTPAYPTVGDGLMAFTQQSNVMVALCFGWLAARPEPRPEPRREPSREGETFLRGAVTLYILITGIVYSLLLADGWESYGTGDTLAHVVVPAAVLADWTARRSRGAPFRAWYPVAWLGYLVCYVTAVLVRGALTDRYPYYFLNPGEVGTDGVATYIAAFLAGFTALGYAVLAAGRAGRPRRTRDAGIAYRT